MKTKPAKRLINICLKCILASSWFSSFSSFDVFFAASSVEKNRVSIFGRRLSRKGRQEPDSTERRVSMRISRARRT